MHSEISPQICQNSHYQENLQITSVSEDVEKREPLCPIDMNVNQCSH